MKKIYFLIMMMFAFGSSNAQLDSAECIIYGPDTICTNTSTRYASKVASPFNYSWTSTSGLQISGATNSSYVYVQSSIAGTYRLYLNNSDSTDTCSTYKDIVVIDCIRPRCCIQYVNSTYQSGIIKIKFSVCAFPTSIAYTKMYINGVYAETQSYSYQPNTTYNHNLIDPVCNQIYCVKICGYSSDGTELCCFTQAIRLDCNSGYTVVEENDYPCQPLLDSSELQSPAEFTITELKVYPNPSTSVLNIEQSGQGQKPLAMFIVNREGVIVKEFKLTAERMSITTSNLPTGVYIIRSDDRQIKPIIFFKQ